MFSISSIAAHLFAGRISGRLDLLLARLQPEAARASSSRLVSGSWHAPFRFAAMLAMSVPSLRSRKPTAASFALLHPETAESLRALQRDPAARLDLGEAGSGAMAVEHGIEGNLLIHYLGAQGSLAMAAGWLGSGRKKYIWIPLRPTLAWGAPGTGGGIMEDEIAQLALDLHTGLDLMGERHVLEEFVVPSPIPEAERRKVLNKYSDFMHAHGWEVTYDDRLSRRALRRRPEAQGPESWSTADRESLARMEALVSETLKGVRPSSRVLFQTR